MLFLDGVYVKQSDRVRFVRTRAPTVTELTVFVHRISLRVGAFLERRGLLVRDMENSYLALDGLDTDNEDALADVLGHSITYRVAVGPQQGQKVFDDVHFGKNEEDWNLNITLYNNQFEDMIANVLVDDVVVGITALQPQNIGDESGSGIEFEFNQKLSENWQISVGGDYLINKLEAQPVARVRLFSRLNYQNGNFGINLIARYLGQVTARKADGVNFQNDLLLDDYWHFGLSGRWQFNENTIFYGKITNLFDKTSYSFSPQVGLEKGLPSRGRGFQFGVTYNFN